MRGREKERKERKSGEGEEREEERQRKKAPIHWSTPQMSTRVKTGQAEAKTPTQVSHIGGKDLTT